MLGQRHTLLTVQTKKGISILYSSDLDTCVETENLILKKRKKEDKDKTSVGCHSRRALLNTGTERNGTEYTGMSRNIPERGGMTPE